MKKGPETYAEAVANFQKSIHELRDAVFESAPKAIKKFFIWLENHFQKSVK